MPNTNQQKPVVKFALRDTDSFWYAENGLDCGNYIVRVDGAVWAAVPERDADRVRAHYA